MVSNSLQPREPQPARLLCPWDFPGKNTGVGYHFLLRGIFPTQISNMGLPYCRQILYPLRHQGQLLRLTYSQILYLSTFEAVLLLLIDDSVYCLCCPFPVVQLQQYYNYIIKLGFRQLQDQTLYHSGKRAHHQSITKPSNF